MRAEGYYWVKYEGEWVVGLYGIDKTLRDQPAVEHWTLPAFIDDSWWHKDEDFDEIDERRIEREESTTIRPQEAFDANNSPIFSRKI